MTYRIEDVVHESKEHWVLDVGARGFEVYKTGVTHSVRKALIAWPGEAGLAKAIAECERREAPRC